MKIAIRNVSTVQLLTGPVLAHICDILQRQMSEHFSPVWEMVPGAIVIADDPRTVGATGVITVYDDAEQQGELGDHELVAGLPFGRIFAKTIIDAGGNVSTGSLCVSATLSHELLEMLADPYANWWSDHPSGDLVALESCDPVEDGSYDIDGISVSNFVGPRWFNPESKGPFDWLKTLQAPFAVTPGGYYILRDGGPQFPSKMLDVRKVMKMLPGSRTSRRIDGSN